MCRGRQQHCRFVHSVASLTTFLPHHVPQAVTHSQVFLKMGNCPKHVELTGIINKPLLLHLVFCLYYLHQWCTVKQTSDNEIYLLIKYIKSVLWREAKRLSYIEDPECLKDNAGVRNRAAARRLRNTVLRYRTTTYPSCVSTAIKVRAAEILLKK